MVSKDQESQSLPITDEIATLKRLTADIIRKQGNRFIKELLRDKGIPIGVNKADFVNNLNNAINEGKLRLGDVNKWLKEVEGWGNQHVYIYNLSEELRKYLTEKNIQNRVKEKKLDKLWGIEIVSDFPENPKVKTGANSDRITELVGISFNDSILRLVWRESPFGWIPVPKKNKRPKKEGLDVFEYRAYRRIEKRAITRFEANLKEKIAGLFIAKPIQGEEHRTVKEEAERDISLLLKNISMLTNEQVRISNVSRNFDQQNVPTNINKKSNVNTQKSRLTSGGAYVEFGSNSIDKPFWDAPAIKDVRKSIGKQQIPAFQGTEGIFIFKGEPTNRGLTRLLRVQLYGEDNRIRLWAQMNEKEVWSIITELSKYQ